MIKPSSIVEQSEIQHKPETSRPVIYTFPRPLFTQK